MRRGEGVGVRVEKCLNVKPHRVKASVFSLTNIGTFFKGKLGETPETWHGTFFY